MSAKNKKVNGLKKCIRAKEDLKKAIEKGVSIEIAVKSMALVGAIANWREELEIQGIGQKRINNLLKQFEEVEKGYRARAIRK